MEERVTRHERVTEVIEKALNCSDAEIRRKSKAARARRVFDRSDDELDDGGRCQEAEADAPPFVSAQRVHHVVREFTAKAGQRAASGVNGVALLVNAHHS